MPRNKKPKLPANQMWDSQSRHKPGHKASDPRGKYGLIGFAANTTGRGSLSSTALAENLAQICRDHGAEHALDTILDLMQAKETPESVRLSAAKFVIERGYGKMDKKTTHTVEAGDTFVDALRVISKQPRVELDGDTVREIPLIDVTPDSPSNARTPPREVQDINALFGEQTNDSQEDLDIEKESDIIRQNGKSALN